MDQKIFVAARAPSTTITPIQYTRNSRARAALVYYYYYIYIYNISVCIILYPILFAEKINLESILLYWTRAPTCRALCIQLAYYYNPENSKALRRPVRVHIIIYVYS